MPYLETDALGLNSFRLCRTSEVLQNETDAGTVEQEVNYQVYTLFNDKLGLIQCTEFNFMFSQALKPDKLQYKDPKNAHPEVKAQVRGQKQLLLSKSLIDDAHWDEMKDFNAWYER